MNEPQSQFVSSSSNWRHSLIINSRKTKFVLCVFFGVYLFLGLCADGLLISSTYPVADIQQIYLALLTFQVFPIATCVMLAIACISVLVTFMFHNNIMLLGTEYREITHESASNALEKQLINCIEEMKIAAGLDYLPKIVVIDANYMNAFASGFSEKSAMLAITSKLLMSLTRSELQAVMAHELSHIRHMDIELTLMSSVLANIMIIILDMLFWNLLYTRDHDENSNRNKFSFILIILRYLLPVINMLLLLYLSRTREFMADAGAVELMRDNGPLASALIKIQQDYSTSAESQNAFVQTPHENIRKEAYIFDPAQAGLHSMASIADVFSTHPSLEQRLAAIGFKKAH